MSVKPLSVRDANVMLQLKKWSDESGVDLKRLNHRGIEHATMKLGVTALELNRLAARAATFTEADHAAILNANKLQGDLAPAAQERVPQGSVFSVVEPGPRPREWFDTKLADAAQQGWTFEVSIPMWPDKQVQGTGVLDALNEGKTVVARRTTRWSHAEGPGHYEKKDERPFTTVGGLEQWLLHSKVM